MLPSLQTLLSVSLQLEVASQHHLFMIGRGGSNVQQIMAKTGASICFPDVTSMMTPGKGSIYISGSMDSVLAARESIIVSVWEEAHHLLSPRCFVLQLMVISYFRAACRLS